MSEAYETAELRKTLQANGFYVKKLADKTTRGLPDSFYAKNGNGIFAEAKYYEVVKLPNEFKAWSSISTGVKMLQLNTLVEMERHFKAVYILIYRVGSEVYYITESPLRLLMAFKNKIPLIFQDNFRLKNEFINVTLDILLDNTTEL